MQNQKKKAQVKDGIAKRSHDGSSIKGLIPTKWPTRITNTATHQLLIGNRMQSYYSSKYERKFEIITPF